MDTKLINAGDDYGFSVDLVPPGGGLFLFRFYGGTSGYLTPGSAEYKRVWICTNGFVAFDMSNSTNPIPNNIPSPQEPNTLIAAVWSDLQVDTNAAIIYGWRQAPFHSFFITWDNVLHKASGSRLTFQMVLGGALGPYDFPSYGQSRFRVSYKNVSGLSYNDYFAFGIENQEGYKGLGGLFDGTKLDGFNQKSYTFYQWRPDGASDEASNYFISNVTLTLNDTCTQTRFRIDRDPQYLRGFNVKLKAPSSPDSEKRYEMALSGIDVLLSEAGGVMVDVFFIGLDFVGILAESLYSNMEYMELRDQFCDNPIPSGAYIITPTPCTTQLYRGCGVDASIGIAVHWILDDDNDMEHSLTITATLQYYELTWNGYVVETPLFVTTSVNMKVTPDSPDKQNNNSFENATQIQNGTYSWLYADCIWDVFDFYKVYVSFSKSICVKLEVDANDNLNLHLYNSTRHLISSSENPVGQNETVNGEQLKYPGDWWYIEVNATWEYGFYNMTISFGFAGSGGDPCPTLFVWNGTGYVDYGVIDIHNPSGEDVIREVPVQKDDAAITKSKAHFMLREGRPGLNFSESVLDQVKLYAIDRYGHQYPCLLVQATHSTKGNVLLQLLLSDDWKTQVLLLETIDLTFIVPYPPNTIQNFVFVVEGCNQYKG